MQTQKLLKITGDNPREQMLALRRALRAMEKATSSVGTRVAQEARQQAHLAYISSFSTEERQVVLKAAQARNPEIETYEDALYHFGTSFLHELQEKGLLADVE